MATHANINKKEDTQMQKETQQEAIIEVLESNFGMRPDLGEYLYRNKKVLDLLYDQILFWG